MRVTREVQPLRVFVHRLLAYLSLSPSRSRHVYPGLAYQALSDAIVLDGRSAEKISAAKVSADLKALFAGAQKHSSGAIEFKGEDADGSSAGLIATSRVLKGLLALSEQVAELNVSVEPVIETEKTDSVEFQLFPFPPSPFSLSFSLFYRKI